MANGVIKKFEEEARKEGKASADFINNTIKQIRSDYAKTPVIKNNAVLSEAWSTITSEISSIARSGLQAKKPDDVKRTLADISDYEKGIKETIELQPLLMPLQDLLSQILPTINDRMATVSSAEANLKKFSSYVTEQSMGFIEGMARSMVGGIPGGQMLLDKTFGAMKRKSAAKEARGQRLTSLGGAMASAGTGGGADMGGASSAVMGSDSSVGVRTGGRETGVEKETRIEEERESDTRWNQLFNYFDAILKALGSGGDNGDDPSAPGGKNPIIKKILAALGIGGTGGLGLWNAIKNLRTSSATAADDIAQTANNLTTRTSTSTTRISSAADDAARAADDLATRTSGSSTRISSAADDITRATDDLATRTSGSSTRISSAADEVVRASDNVASGAQRMSTAGDDVLTRATTLGTRLDEAGKAAAAGAEALSGKGVILSGSIDEISKAMDAANMSYDKAAGRFKSLATGKFINFASAEKAIQEGLEAGLKGAGAAADAAGAAPTGASGLVGKIFSKLGSSLLMKGLIKIAGWPLSVAELGKDIMDVGLDKEAMKTDVTAKVKNEDTFAIAGSLIGGAFGAFLGPLGIAAGASIGNLIGEQIGKAMDDPDVVDAVAKAKEEIDLDITNVKDSIKSFNDKLKDASLSDKTKEYYEQLRDLKQKELDGLTKEKDKLVALEETLKKRDDAAEAANKIKREIQDVERMARNEKNKESRQALSKLKKDLETQLITKTTEFAGTEAVARFQAAQAGVEGVDAEIDVIGSIFDKDVRDMSIKELTEQIGRQEKERDRQIMRQVIDPKTGNPVIPNKWHKADKPAAMRQPYEIAIELLKLEKTKKESILAKAQNKQWGGGLNSDKPYFVGEAGPELWNPTMGDLIPSRNILGPALNRMSASNTLAGTIGGGMNGGGMNSVINAPSTIIQNVQQNELSDPYSWGHASMLRESA